MICNPHDRRAWRDIQAVWPWLVLLLAGSSLALAERLAKAGTGSPRALLLVWAGVGTFLVLSVVLAGALESWLADRTGRGGAWGGDPAEPRERSAAPFGELAGRPRGAVAIFPAPKSLWPLRSEAVPGDPRVGPVPDRLPLPPFLGKAPTGI